MAERHKASDSLAETWALLDKASESVQVAAHAMRGATAGAWWRVREAASAANDAALKAWEAEALLGDIRARIADTYGRGAIIDAERGEIFTAIASDAQHHREAERLARRTYEIAAKTAEGVQQLASLLESVAEEIERARLDTMPESVAASPQRPR